MNILFTSAGRRGYLINYFKKALGGKGLIYAGNSSSFSAAFQYADRNVITPKIYDENYIPFLLEFCLKENIKLIIPLFDVDLPILSKSRQLFEKEGIRVLVSGVDVVNICNDKWETYLFCKKNVINCPKTYLSLKDAVSDIDNGSLSFPLFVKPRWGMGSISIYKACNTEELTVFYKKVQNEVFSSYLKYESAIDENKCVLIQEFLNGQEYGMDVINDFNSNYRFTSVKKKIAMRSGETDCAMVVKNDMLQRFGQRLSLLLHHIGNLDVDVFLVNNEPFLLEMNARFGGGYPFSQEAGINLPLAIIKWLNGETTTDEFVIKSFGKVYQKDIRLIELSNITEAKQ